MVGADDVAERLALNAAGRGLLAHHVANHVKRLGANGETVVLRLFEAAFAAEPAPGQWEQFGTAILPMQIQRRDQWNGVHYALAEYYESRTGESAALMTEVACIAWNAVVRRRWASRQTGEQVLATIPFRGASCDLIEDYSHIQRALADHRDIFQGHLGQESECLTALLRVLDLFVEAGWAEARQLTHRLEEIYT
ncbi:MAG: hypothetical protein FJ276_29200 [Planctomycetes bacterium]|nr:hypothetical protein [Planctomycetota bacterium]